MKYRWLYFALSGLALAVSIFSLARWRMRLSIDFRGGNFWEIAFSKKVDAEQWSSFIKSQEGILELQRTKSDTWMIKSDHTTLEKKTEIAAKIKEKFGEFKELRFESLEPSLGKDLLFKTLIGIALASIGILVYITVRFQKKLYGIAAVLAMFHDSVILLGAFSLLGHFFKVEIDSLFVTAFLTILSFSVHDTVVVYDRLRELKKIYPKLSFTAIANLAITQTLTRSLNNSMTIIFVLIALYLLGGEATHWFSLALLIGTISGTYSSTFTAIPLLVTLQKD